MTRLVTSLRRAFTAPAVRYPPDPRALFVLVLCVASGIPLIFANATPGSLAAKLDPPVIVAWGLMLTGGSLLSLIGALRQTVNGVIIEQVGSVALGFACIIYAAAIWFAIQWVAAVPMFFLLAFGLASLWRWGQLQGYLRAVEHLAQEIRDEADE